MVPANSARFMKGMVSPGAAGFSLSAAMSTTGLLNWMVRSAAETEAQMNSVERILQFADDVPAEKQVISGGTSSSTRWLSGPIYSLMVERLLIIADPVEEQDKSSAIQLSPRRADESWPSTGRIVFDNYQLRYRPGLDLALKGINCTIESNEKVLSKFTCMEDAYARNSRSLCETDWGGGQNRLRQKLDTTRSASPGRSCWWQGHH